MFLYIQIAYFLRINNSLSSKELLKRFVRYARLKQGMQVRKREYKVLCVFSVFYIIAKKVAYAG